jgi:hypothetical protein
MISGAKGLGKGGEAHQGLVVARAAAEDGRRRWPCGGGGAALADRLQQKGSGFLGRADRSGKSLRRRLEG